MRVVLIARKQLVLYLQARGTKAGGPLHKLEMAESAWHGVILEVLPSSTVANAMSPLWQRLVYLRSSLCCPEICLPDTGIMVARKAVATSFEQYGVTHCSIPKTVWVAAPIWTDQITKRMCEPPEPGQSSLAQFAKVTGPRDEYQRLLLPEHPTLDDWMPMYNFMNEQGEDDWLRLDAEFLKRNPLSYLPGFGILVTDEVAPEHFRYLPEEHFVHVHEFTIRPTQR
jgi:hypothetical protein